MEFNKRKASFKIRALLNRAFKSIQHNTEYARSKDPSIREPPKTTDHLEIERIIVNKGHFRPDIKLHGRGMFGKVHHPSCRVKITFKEILDESIVESYKKSLIGRRKSEFEKLAYSIKKHKVNYGLRDRPIVWVNKPWSSKGWKYVTSEKWKDPDITIKRRY